MTLPLDIILSDNYEDLKDQLTLMYKDIANAVNGHNNTWTPVVEGDTSAGVGVYSLQKGQYYLKGNIVDCWFSLTLTGHTGTGDLKIKLPFTIRKSSDFWAGEVTDSNLTYPSGTRVTLQGINNTKYLNVIASGDGIASAPVQIDATLSLIGHIRFIIED